jgi:cobalt-zinc-cadmium efflux system protein
MSAALAGAGTPAAAAAVIRVPEVAPSLGIGMPIAGPVAVTGLSAASLPSAFAPGAAVAPSAFAAPAASAARPLAAPVASAAVPLAAPAVAAAAPLAALPTAAAPADGPSRAEPGPAAARAAALFDGSAPAAADGPDWDIKPGELIPARRLSARTRRLFGAKETAPGPLARVGDFVARATGVAALWSLYRDGVLVQRYAQRMSDRSLPDARRAASARMLAKLGRVEAVPALGLTAESDPSARVRRVARAALVFLAESAAPRLLATLKRNPFPVSREAAAVGLGWLLRHAEVPGALDALGASGLMDRSEGARMSAIQALAGASSPKAVAVLAWMHGVETRPTMRAAVERALTDATARHAAAGRMHLIPPAEDLPLAASPLHAAALKSSIAIGLTFAAIEFAGGLMTGTLALRADALHLAGDRALDAAALLAMSIARRPPTSRKTYGWLKAEAVFSFVGALAIAGMGLAMIPGAYAAFVHPVAAQGWSVLGFAALSIVSNLTSAYMLHRHQGEHSGVRGAFLHALTDAVGTFGVMLAAAASLLFGWTFLLPLATAAMVVMVLRVAWELGRPAWDVLLDSVPRGVDMDRLESDLRAVTGVASVYDLHVRALNSQGAELNAKLYATPGTDHAVILASVNAFLRERYGIVHSTIQIEPLPSAKR